jgi:phenylacetate-coenzyme A ligase PaaK-like adenylate-forming protein
VTTEIDALLNFPPDAPPDQREFIEAAMNWHFSKETGSAYWLERAKSLNFDPRADVRTIDDLALFPNIVDELRDVPAEDLIPRGYGPAADVIGVYESGGTTGTPKRVVLTADWLNTHTAWLSRRLDDLHHPRDLNWLLAVPSGPHMVDRIMGTLAKRRGGLSFGIDIDPRWVKTSIAEGRRAETERYAAHILEQCAVLLRTQNIGVLCVTPPILELICASKELTGLVSEKVRAIIWSGAHMDPDTRRLLKTKVFPQIALCGWYGSTLVFGASVERAGASTGDMCVFDAQEPYVSFRVVAPGTRRTVGYGERGQVVMSYVGKCMLLPNNLERDMATRVRPAAGRQSDGVADVTPVPSFGGATVIEGVY